MWGAVGGHAVSAASDVAARVLPQHRPHLVARRQPRDGGCVGRRVEGHVAALKVAQLQTQDSLHYSTALVRRKLEASGAALTDTWPPPHSGPPAEAWLYCHRFLCRFQSRAQ